MVLGKHNQDPARTAALRLPSPFRRPNETNDTDMWNFQLQSIYLNHIQATIVAVNCYWSWNYRSFHIRCVEFEREMWIFIVLDDKWTPNIEEYAYSL